MPVTYIVRIVFFSFFSMRKTFLFSAGAMTILTLVACSANGQDTSPSQNDVPRDTSVSSSEPMDISSSASSQDAQPVQQSSSASDVSDNTDATARIVEVSVDNWAFSPNTITAKQGEKVVVRWKGIAGMHSFASKDLGINVAIDPGETKDVTIPTDKAGTFAFRCAVPCGPGHRDMTGQIVVEA